MVRWDHGIYGLLGNVGGGGGSCKILLETAMSRIVVAVRGERRNVVPNNSAASGGIGHGFVEKRLYLQMHSAVMCVLLEKAQLQRRR